MRDSSNVWTYYLEPDAPGVEYGHWQGDDAVPLGLHFHDSSQLTLVLSGSRLFQLTTGNVQVRAGQCLYIPAGLPHRSLPHSDAGTRCYNAYLHVRRGCGPTLLSAAEIADYGANAGPEALLAGIARDRFSVVSSLLPETSSPSALPGVETSIGQIAAYHGVSREAFTRTFSRRFGMPPHAYRIVHRLNKARRLIKTGEPLAGIAAELGFADQSHFGRHFRRVFGVSPQTYREAMR